eukprot:superscaffoldBa00001618_g11320
MAEPAAIMELASAAKLRNILLYGVQLQQSKDPALLALHEGKRSGSPQQQQRQQSSGPGMSGRMTEAGECELLISELLYSSWMVLSGKRRQELNGERRRRRHHPANGSDARVRRGRSAPGVLDPGSLAPINHGQARFHAHRSHTSSHSRPISAHAGAVRSWLVE